jgi:hypothetical protein
VEEKIRGGPRRLFGPPLSSSGGCYFFFWGYYFFFWGLLLLLLGAATALAVDYEFFIGWWGESFRTIG